jgi:malate synthase
VAINGMMEDAATAEISRSQIWQWLRNDVVLDTGEVVTPDLVRRILDEELARLAGTEGYDEGRYRQAADLFAQVALSEEFVDFLTVPAYELLD